MNTSPGVPLKRLVIDINHYADRVDVIESILMTRSVQGPVYTSEMVLSHAFCGRAALLAEAAICRTENQFSIATAIKMAIFQNDKPEIFSAFKNGERYVVLSDGLVQTLRDLMTTLAATEAFDLMFGRNTRTVRRHEGYAELQLETYPQPLIERLSEKAFLFALNHELAHLILGHNQLVSKIDSAGDYLSRANEVILGMELRQYLELQADQTSARMSTADSIVASHDFSPFSDWTRLCILMFSAVSVWAFNSSNQGAGNWNEAHPPLPIRALNAFTSVAEMLENLAADNLQFNFLNELHERMIPSLLNIFAISYQALKQSGLSFDPELFRECSTAQGMAFMQKMSAVGKTLQSDLDAVSIMSDWRRPHY